jgi:hypothetical protein
VHDDAGHLAAAYRDGHSQRPVGQPGGVVLAQGESEDRKAPSGTEGIKTTAAGSSRWRRGRPTDSTVPVGTVGLCPGSGMIVRLVEFGLNPPPRCGKREADEVIARKSELR